MYAYNNILRYDIRLTGSYIDACYDCDPDDVAQTTVLRDGGEIVALACAQAHTTTMNTDTISYFIFTLDTDGDTWLDTKRQIVAQHFNRAVHDPLDNTSFPPDLMQTVL